MNRLSQAPEPCRALVGLCRIEAPKMIMRDAGMLTPVQRRTLETIMTYTIANGFPPTLRELGTLHDIGSTNGVSDTLQRLEKKGYIRTRHMGSRAIEVLRDPNGYRVTLTWKRTDDEPDRSAAVSPALSPEG